MKESSCHNAKMATYYREVCQLEDKFDGLELNHIPRCFNEVAALAKAVSGKGPVPTSVFANDQHEPSVRYEGSEQANDGLSDPASRSNQPTAPSSPEVMELEEDPATEPDPLINWRMPYLDYLLYDTLPTDKGSTARTSRQILCSCRE